VFASPGFPKETIELGNGRRVHIDAPGASPSDYYVQSLRLNGASHPGVWVNYSRLAAGVTLNWTLGSNPTAWGSAPADAPPSYSAGLRSVVGYVSQQHVTVAPGSSATIQLGTQNATARPQRAQFHITLPTASGLAVSPLNGTLSLEPSGRQTREIRVSASASALSRFDWVTATVTAAGGRPQTVELAVQIT
jgi:hypothetical protein